MLSIFLLLSLLLSITIPRAFAATTVNVVDIANNAMDFHGGTVTSGTAGSLNAVYKYLNVITKDGVQVDATVTITDNNGVTLEKLDDDTTFSTRLNPVVTTTNGTGSMTLKVDFINHNTGLAVSLKNFFVTVIDIDGSSTTQKEFVELSGFASYTVNNPTQLTIGAGSNGRTKFLGRSSSLSGITFEDTASFISNYTAPISSISLAVGNAGTLSSRQFSINFGALGASDHFTTPQTIVNASAPTLSVAIDDGGDGQLTAGNDNIGSVNVSGTTNAGTGQSVILEATDSKGYKQSYAAAVANNGTYSLNLDLSTFAYGTITVTANTVNAQGNPASTATDTTIKVNQPPTVTGDTKTTNEDTPVSGTVTGQDDNGDALTYSVVSQPAHGSVTLNSGGTYTYTPSANYNGTDSFTVKVNDGTVDSASATVNLTINAVNDAPIANGSSKTTPENTPLNASVSGSDVEGSPLTYIIVTNPAHGNVTLNTDGTYTYTPVHNYNGTDSFTFKANDGSADSAPATVNITITLVNETPIVADSSKSTLEDTPVSGTVTASDGDGDSLSYIVVTQPAHGTVTLNQDGTYTYTPSANYNGADSFTFKVNDGTVNSATATVSLTITAVNDVPTANGSTKTTPEDIAVDGTVSGSDVEENPLTYTIVTNPSHGSVTLNSDGTYTYTPNANYNGTDSFTFKANDGSADSEAATVTITVTPVNDVPTVANSSKSTQEDTPVNGTVTASDNDEDHLTYTIVTQPAHGTVTLNQDGTYTYAPSANYNGADSFTYKVNDGTVDSSIATVSLTITAVNDVPLANDSTKTTPEDAAVDGTVSGSDVEESPLTYTIVTNPAHGSVTLNSDGTYTYTPNANYNGTDSFTFKANDGSADSEAATVTITVTPVNDVPTVANSSKSTQEDTPVNGTVTASDNDEDHLTYTIVTQPAHGTVTLNQDGTYTYTPSANYNGADSFTYKVNDGTVDSSIATVSLTITAVNDVPLANDSTKTTPEDTAVDGTVSGSDVEESPLTYTVVTNPAHGSVTLNSDGTYTYTPNVNYNGTDSFTFKANDGSADSEAATVTITVTPVNDAPTATDDNVSLEANEIANGSLIGHDVEGDTLTFALVSGPSHGSVTVNTNGTYEYKPTADFGGLDSFTFKVNDGTLDSNTATIRLTVNLLEGWVGSRSASITTPEWVVAPDKPLKLSAYTSIQAEAVKAVFDFDGSDEGSANDEVDLTLVNAESYSVDGFKKWENVTYRLPKDIAEGHHEVNFVASNVGGNLPSEALDKKMNNKFIVVKYVGIAGTILDRDSSQPIQGAKVTLYDPTGTQIVSGPVDTDASGRYSFPHVRTEQYLIDVKKDSYAGRTRAVDALPSEAENTVIEQDFKLVKYILKLNANPSSIVGDGNTTSTLSAVLTDMEGKPLAGVPITFSALVGAFVGSPVAETDTYGKASVLYRSAKIEGILSQQIPVTATAVDAGRDIYAQEQIIVTFEPASVSGVVATTTDGVRAVLSGVRVKVTKDFDNDGIIDFAAEAITDANGKYSLAVPRGDVQYDVEVIKTVQVGDVKKDVVFKQTAEVGTVTGTGGEVFDSTKTATGILVTQLPGGQKKLMDENDANDQQFAAQVRIKLKDPTTGNFVTIGGQSSFTLSADGVFNIPGLTLNQEYELAIVYSIPDEENHGASKEIIVNSLDNEGTLPRIKVSSNGEMNILDELIDPYGDITNINTHTAIDGAIVKLYYANTPRNITNGVTPGTEVVLPLIPGFAPNNNANPQTSRDGGKYAYMVYPTTDYYLVANAAGYETYTSPTIPVEFTIVRHDINMRPVAGSVIIPITVDKKPDLSVNAKVDRSRQEENSAGTIQVSYSNKGAATTTGATVTLTLPEGTVVTDADGGKVEGTTVTWQVGDLKAGDGGEHNVKVRYPSIDKPEVLTTISVVGKAGAGVVLDPAVAQSSLKVLLFSNRFDQLTHTRYILGYPDKLFHPNNNLTRAELAAIVARLLNGGNTALKAEFKDVPTSHWASGYIRIATDSGIFNGFNDSTFRPDIPVTREELAVVMTRFLKLDVAQPIKPYFKDSQDRWSTSAIEALYRNGLIAGYKDGTFKPGNAIIRLEAVTMINSLLFRGPLTNVNASFPDVDKNNWAFGQVEEATRSHKATRTADGAENYTQALDDQVK
ncbi:Ig-like domain-containing protein [Paenibacillus pectinilyticus]|nr:Ig-like domain-containing protein [Paenibacillus pectinilyticus]